MPTTPPARSRIWSGGVWAKQTFRVSRKVRKVGREMLVSEREGL